MSLAESLALVRELMTSLRIFRASSRTRTLAVAPSRSGDWVPNCSFG